MIEDITILARHDERLKNIESQLPKIWGEMTELREENSKNWKHFFESQQSTKVQVAMISGSMGLIVSIIIALISIILRGGGS